jgi:N-glycosylase/DNA lyase
MEAKDRETRRRQVDAVDERRRILTEACEKMQYDVFLSLVQPEKANEEVGFGFTPLHILVKTLGYGPGGSRLLAAYEPRRKTVDTLLDWGVNINQASFLEKRTPLWEAVQNAEGHMVAHLLKRGADMRLLVYTISSKGPLTILQWDSYFTRKYEEENSRLMKLFMMHGAKPEEFRIEKVTKVDDFLETEQMKELYGRIVNTREALTALIGSRERSPTLRIVGKDIVRYLAQIVYQTRDQDCWALEIERPKKRHAP